MKRANILFEGPPRGAKYCGGCPLWEIASDARGSGCPIFGDVYQETEGPGRGCLCRAPECIGNEHIVEAGIKNSNAYFRRWVASPFRDKIG
jgi:hypothetical protein